MALELKKQDQTIKIKDTPTKEIGSMDQFISYLMVCRNVLHAMHLKSSVESEHEALGELYEALPDLIDLVTEAYQGYYGILLNLKFETGNEYLSMKPLDYVSEILKHIEYCKGKYKDNSMILNEIDNIVKVVSQAKYKLKFLPQ